MSEGGAGKTPPKPKVGADGLTKKERKAQKQKPKPESKDGKENEKKVEKPTQNNSPPKAKTNAEQKPVTAKVETKNNEQKDSKNTETVLNAGQEGDKNTEGKTKAELKAERKAQIEKELAAKKLEKKDEAGLSKAELKAQRRALQEKQREAKTAPPAKPKAKEGENTVKTELKPSANKDKKSPLKKTPTKKVIKPTSIKNKHPHFEMIEHMCYKSPVEELNTIRDDIHPAFNELGAKMSFKIIKGANARALALISAMKKLVSDYVTPTNQEFCRSLETYLQDSVDFLAKCRPLSSGMANIVRSFKLTLTKVDKAIPDAVKKDELLTFLSTFLENEIVKAGDAISMKTREKIADGDVILTYGGSSLVEKILIDAKTQSKQNFSVVIADSRPFTEGRILLTRLVSKGIPCSFVLINAVSSIMSKVSKVLLGAHSLLSNGFVMSRIGTGQLAMIAKDFHKPVLICCETYKFCERVQTDSYIVNEIGDSNLLEKISFLEEPNSEINVWKSTDNIIPMHLLYDVAAPDVISAVVTELGILPCTSVPAVLRERQTY